MLAEPNARRQLTLFAANGRQIHERSADIAEIMRGAAVAAPEIAAMLRQLAEGRRAMRGWSPRHCTGKAHSPRMYLSSRLRTSDGR